MPPARRGADTGAARTKPTRAELAAAAGRCLPDRIGDDLQVLFCGINPSLYSAAIGHHFARPGNRFWPTLYRAGFTDRLLTPQEDQLLPRFGAGLTNLVERATARADELSAEEIRRGTDQLLVKLRGYRPRCIAFLGIGAFRTAFAQPRAAPGRQREPIDATTVWVLPNPSGLNAHYQIADLTALFAELRHAIRA